MAVTPKNATMQDIILRCITKQSKVLVDQVKSHQRLIDKSSTPLIPYKGVLHHVLHFGL